MGYAAINMVEYSDSSPTTGSMNSTSNSDIFELRLSLVFLSMYVIAHGFLVTNAVIGNIAVIHTIFTRCKLNPHYVFLRSLAFADLSTAAIAIAPTLFARVVISSATCLSQFRTLFFAPVFMFCVVSILHLVILTVDRFIAVSRPLKYRVMMSDSRCKSIVMSAWIGGVLFAAIPIIGGSIDPNQWVCGTTNYAAGLATIHTALVAGAPPVIAVMLLSFHLRILRIAKRHLKRISGTRIAGMSDARVQQLETKSRIRATVTVVLIVSVFGICWLPVSIKTIVDEYVAPPETVQFTYQTVTEYFALANSALNPIIYAMRYKRFRVTYLLLLGALCPFISRKSNQTGHDDGESTPTSGQEQHELGVLE